MIRNLAIRLIEGYQRRVSRPLNTALNSRCLYEPSCSEYTKEAIRKDGTVKGGIQGALRLLRCSPAVRVEEGMAFVRLLQESDREHLDRHLLAADEEARELVETLRTELARTPVASAWEPASKPILDLLGRLDIRTVDPPRHLLGEARGFVVRKLEDPGDTCSLPLNESRIRRVAVGALGLAGGLASAVMGGAVGLLAGSVTGGILGGAAALDKEGEMNRYVADHFSPPSVVGLALLEEKCGAPAQKLRDALRGAGLPSPLSSSVSLVPGIVSGIVLGAWHTGRYALPVAWNGGRALARYFVVKHAHDG